MADFENGIKEYIKVIYLVSERLKKVSDDLTSTLNAGGAPSLFEIESCATQLRLACEGILFASFVFHADVVDEISAALHRRDKWGKLKKMLERANERYMPVPIELNDAQTEVNFRDDDIISGAELFKIWGELSEYLHYPGYAKSDFDIRKSGEFLHSVFVRLMKLLSQHMIFMPDTGVAYFVQLRTKGEKPAVKYYRWERIEPSAQP